MYDWPALPQVKGQSLEYHDQLTPKNSAAQIMKFSEQYFYGKTLRKQT